MSIPRFSPKEAVVLELLAARGEMYGLELVEQSGGRLKRGTVYVTLSRMEDKGLVRSRLEGRLGESGPPRRLYEVTGLGFRAMSAARAAEQAFRKFDVAPGATGGAGGALLLPVVVSAAPLSSGAVGSIAVGVLFVVLCLLAALIYGVMRLRTTVDLVGRGKVPNRISVPILPRLRAEVVREANGVIGVRYQWTRRQTRNGDVAGSRRSVKLAPGTRLRSLAKLMFTKRTNTLVFEPLLTDFEVEYLEALAEGAAGKARWIRVKYTVAFFAAMASRVPVSLASLVRLVLRAG